MLELCPPAPSAERCGYHGVAAVAGQDDDVDGRRVVGHTDSSVLGFVLAAGSQTGRSVNIKR